MTPIFASAFHRVRPLVRVIALAFTAGALGLAAARGNPPAPSPYAFYERFVAIDAVCAWPSLHALPNGELAVLIWPYESHGRSAGAVESWLSTDHGVKWRKAGVPVPVTGGDARINPAAGVVDGNLVAIVGGFNNRPPYEEGLRFWPSEKVAELLKDSVSLLPASSISRDSGRTWEPHFATGFGRGPYSEYHLIPYGRIAKLPDGAMGAMLYGDAVYFYVSRDGGKSWTRRGVVSPPNPDSKRARRGFHNETTWVVLDNGDLFAAGRSFPKEDGMGGQSLDAFRSTDGGATWTQEQELALPNQIPADLMRAPDGRLLLTYSSRNPGSRGVWFRFGTPDGRIWSQPYLLVDLEGSLESQYPGARPDGGYPSTVLAADGTFVTAYYSRGIPAHQRYHMGVVRWRLTGARVDTSP